MKNRTVYIEELASFVDLTPDEIQKIVDKRCGIPAPAGRDSRGVWWFREEIEVWADAFKRSRALTASIPSFGLSAADVAWVKLKRHEEECGRDGPCSRGVAIGHGAPKPEGCKEHGELYDAYRKAKS